MISSINVGGILIRCKAFSSVAILTESKAFDMSCDSAQSSFPLVLASSIICVSCVTGCIVDWWGNAAKFMGDRISYRIIVVVSLLLMIFVNSFRVWSIRVIGLVVLRSYLYFFFFGMGHTFACSHLS